jgi:deoxyribose-phosphate aldolase
LASDLDFDPAAIARRALPLLDLTSLNDGDEEADVLALCRRARSPAGDVAAVCIWPEFVPTAVRALRASPIKVATVVNFPGGTMPLDRVLGQIATALADGADEIDVVMPYATLLMGAPHGIHDFLARCREACGSRIMKVILETGLLAKPALVERAAAIAVEAGADFLKTSTGKVPTGATPGAATILLEACRAATRPIGVKISGGVRDIATAGTYLALADRVCGPGWVSPATFRFGASGLLDTLLAALGREQGGTSADSY